MQFLKQTNQLNGTVVFTGPHFSMEEAEKIVDSVWERNEKLLSEWCELAKSISKLLQIILAKSHLTSHLASHLFI